MTNPVIDKDGNKYWFNSDNHSLDSLHRDDGPAMELANGTKAWYINGKLHREDGPAIEHCPGANACFINEMFHLKDHPNQDGTEYW